jgi:hypothetical protein
MIIDEKIQGRGCHGRGRHVRERKKRFIKNDMSRNKNAIRLKLETSIAFVFRGLAEENA